MRGHKIAHRWQWLLPIVLSIFLLAGMFGLLAPAPALAAGGSLTIEGPGLAIQDPDGDGTPGVTITQYQLRGTEALPPALQQLTGWTYLPQHDELYSTVNTWPTKNFYRGKGVKLTDLLQLAGGLNDQATLIKFIASDGFAATFTVRELVYEPRYRYPNFMYDEHGNWSQAGHIIGDTSGAVLVEPMIAWKSGSSPSPEDLSDEENLSTADANHLLYGQRAVTQQTNARFAKYTVKIQVLTDEVPKWGNPTASVPPGEVEAGTLVELHSPYDDEDKVHYTLDGSDPTIHSPMYNWIASRWWSSREDVLDEINKPIEITKSTTIKAFVTGPGRADSDVVTFEYTVPSITPTFGLGNEDEVNTAKSALGITDEEEITGSATTVGQYDSFIADENTALLKGKKYYLGLKVAVEEPALDTPIRFGIKATEGINYYLKDTIGTWYKNPTVWGPGTTQVNNEAYYAGVTSPVFVEIPEDFEGSTVQVTISMYETADPNNVFGAQTFTFTVGQPVAVTGVGIAEGDQELAVGQTVQLTAVVEPENATNKNVTWASSNEAVATVNATGLVTAVAEGTATITVMTEDGGYTDSITVTVKKASGSDPVGEVVLTITGDGVANTKEFTLSQLEEMPQHQEVYSCINTWPSKKWYVGRGVKLNDLLRAAGGIKPGATLIKFYASDGYYMTLTVQELLRDRRYRFPNFKTGGGDGDGHIPGDPSGAVEVETILALVSAEGTDDPRYMNDANTPLLMLGQRAVTEQTGPLFVKNVNKIEVLTTSPGKWDAPKATPGSGTVPAGTLVELSNDNMDIDKIYYTTDGSTPDLNSPMYNWIARRWWAARGEETVAKINHPIKITKDTTIKAITIGPGKRNSDVVTFTYKVAGAVTGESGAIKPDVGGRVSLGDEAVIEIPAGALTGTSPVEVKIERVTEPPAVPAGFKLLGDVYEFSVGGNTSYSFNKAVTITLSFDPGALGEGETPALYYYDEAKGQWIHLGGTVSGNTVTVQVEHFTKFAVMVTLPTNVTVKIKPSEGGTVSLGEEATMEIPANALTGTQAVEVKIERVSTPPAAPAGFRLLGSVYEFTVDGKQSYSFAKKVTIRLRFDPEKVGSEETPAIHYYDETGKKWVNVGGEVLGNTISVEIDHLTKYAVMAEEKLPQQLFKDTAGHWAENNIKELVELGAIGGYPDGTFRPDNRITRAEFATILVKAFKLEPRSGKVFADTAGHWAKETIATAASYGIVSGYNAATFAPDDPVTREQMAVMIVKAAKLAPGTGELSFKDGGRVSAWAKEAVVTAVQNGIINGYPDNTLRPQGNATRAEAVTVILNALRKAGVQ